MSGHNGPGSGCTDYGEINFLLKVRPKNHSVFPQSQKSKKCLGPKENNTMIDSSCYKTNGDTE